MQQSFEKLSVNCPSDTKFVLFIITCFLCPQDSSEIHFKVKMTTHLKKLKESYSQRQVVAEREPGSRHLLLNYSEIFHQYPNSEPKQNSNFNYNLSLITFNGTSAATDTVTDRRASCRVSQQAH